MADDTDLDELLNAVTANLAGGVSSYTRPDGSVVSIANPEVAMDALRKYIEMKDNLKRKMSRPLTLKVGF